MLKVSRKQAQKLGLSARNRLSPHLEKCCVLLSANVSYAHAAQDLEVLTGVKVSPSTQQRLVHRYEFAEPPVPETVETLSLDGGKVRLRTPKGQASEWRDYKAITLHEQACAAYFQDNAGLVAWLNQRPLAAQVVCLGDGHDGVWNLIDAIATAQRRWEILDWYHLNENLHKVGGHLTACDKWKPISGTDELRRQGHCWRIGMSLWCRTFWHTCTSIGCAYRTTRLVSSKASVSARERLNLASSASACG